MLLMLLIQITLAYQEVNFMICWANHHWVVSLCWCWGTRLTNQGLSPNKHWPIKCKINVTFINLTLESSRMKLFQYNSFLIFLYLLPSYYLSAEKCSLLCRDLKSITDREVCCFMISCKNSTNIDSVIDWLVKHSKSKSWEPSFCIELLCNIFSVTHLWIYYRL